MNNHRITARRWFFSHMPSACCGGQQSDAGLHPDCMGLCVKRPSRFQ